MANPTFFPDRPFQLRINTWVKDQDFANNRSLIGWQLWIDKNSTSPTQSGGQAHRWVKLNGIFVNETYTNGFNFVDGWNFLINEGENWWPHNADGTLPMYVESQADFDVLGLAPTAGTALSVPTIPRASLTTIDLPAYRDAGTAVLLKTNRASSSFTHTIKYTYGAASGTIATGVGDTYNWVPPLNLLQQIPNTTSALLTLITETYNGGTLIGTRESSFTLQAGAGVIPTIANLSVVDDNPTVASIVGKFVQGLSILKATVNASGVQGSTIKARAFTMGPTTVPSGGVIPITASGSIPITAAATDSRGRVAAWAGSIDALAYAPPLLNSVQVRRSDAAGVLSDNGTSLRVDLNAAVSSLINSTQRNNLTYKVFTRARGTGPWTPRNSVVHGSLAYNSFFVVSGGANYPINAAFDVMVQVVDKFNTAAVTIEIPTAGVFMHWSLTGVGIGGYHALGRLDVNGDVYSDGRLVPVIATDTEALAKAAADLALTPLNLAALTATQAQADAGTDSARLLTPATVRERAYAPYATAAGLKAVTASGNTVITFPTGRFSVSPIVTLQAEHPSNVVVARIVPGTLSATSVAVQVWTIGGAQVAGSIWWEAVQMTAGAAAG